MVMNELAHIKRPDEALRELALFAGAGGGILGGKLLGWETVAAVEIGAYPSSVLCARQNDGILPPFPIWSDVQTFDGRPWRGLVDVVSGGFPCQDISVAGRGAGIDGDRSGMWVHMARIIGEVRPQFAFVENSPALVTRGLGVVLGDLAALGYDCKWGVLGAADVGANHQRDRFWLVATDTRSNRCRVRPDEYGSGQFKSATNTCINGKKESLADSEFSGLERFRFDTGQSEFSKLGNSSWWKTEPNVDRVGNGLVARVDRLKAIGNGQVPLCAATAWRLLT